MSSIENRIIGLLTKKVLCRNRETLGVQGKCLFPRLDCSECPVSGTKEERSSDSYPTKLEEARKLNSQRKLL